MRKLASVFIISILFTYCKKDKEISKSENTKIDTSKVYSGEKFTETKTNTSDSIENEKSEKIKVNENYIQKATINKSDSIIWITANMRLDHRIFGYEKADLNSKKMFLLSIFTNDVENNPFNCQYGAFYDTNGMENMKLKFIENVGSFAKINILKENTKAIIYIDRKWLEFEQE